MTPDLWKDKLFEGALNRTLSAEMMVKSPSVHLSLTVGGEGLLTTADMVESSKLVRTRESDSLSFSSFELHDRNSIMQGTRFER